MDYLTTTYKPVIHEGESCSFYLDSADILVINAKDFIFTIESISRDFNLILDVIGDRKVKLIFDANSLLPFEKSIRLKLEEMLNKVGIAMAVTTQSRVGRMVANIFFALSTTKIPMKMFSNKEHARLWLDTF